MKIAIVARRTPEVEPQHDRYRACALARGHDVVDVDVGAFISGSVSLTVGGALIVGGVDLGLGGVAAVLLGPLPGAAARTSPDELLLSGRTHARLTRTQLERHQLAWALLRELEHRGVPVLSPTAAHLFDEKPTQLFALHRAGLPIPPSQLGDGDGADDAGDDAGDDAVVVKAISGGPARTGVARRRGVPVIAQPRLWGADLRAVVVGGVCVVVGRFDDDDDRIVDVRERPGFVDGTTRWVRDDDDDAAALAVAAAGVCGVDVAAVDLKRTATGLVLLEVNRTPVLIDIEDDTGAAIADRVIDLVEIRGRAS